MDDLDSMPIYAAQGSAAIDVAGYVGDRISLRTRGVRARPPRRHIGQRSSDVLPARAQGALVERRTLLDRLTHAPRVTQLVAPAGSGKTLLVRSWIDQLGLADSVAWVTVPRDARDAELFWTRITDALRATRPGKWWGREPHNCGPMQLVAELGKSREPTWLVIDDVHELRAAGALCQLETLLLHASEALRFVLIARRDVPVGLHRLRLAGELAELKSNDLRFTPAQARELFEVSGLSLSERAVQSLHRCTDGWAAGLRFAALTMAGHPDPERAAADFSGAEHSVHQYVLAEVLESQSAEIKRFLSLTSPLERVNGALADTLTGESRGEAMLLELEALGLATALDEQRTWFRYQPWLTDVLRIELRRSSAAEPTRLHAAAASWFALHDRPIEGIRHAQAAHDWMQAARLLSDHAPVLEMRGQHATVRHLLAQFPSTVIEGDAELAMLKALDETRYGSLHAAARFVRLATRHIESTAEHRRASTLARLTAVRLERARHCADLPMMVEQAQELLVRTNGADAGDVGAIEELRAYALIALALASSWNETSAVDGGFEEGVRIARRRGLAHLEVLALAHWSLTASLRAPSAAVDRAQRAIEIACRNGWSETVVAAPAYLALGLVSVWRGEVEEAERSLQKAAIALANESEPALDCLLHFARAALALARGDDREAFKRYCVATQHAERLPAPHPLTQIVRGATRYASLRSVDDSATEKMRTLDVLGDSMTAVSSVCVLLLDAIAHETRGDRPESERRLEQALDLAEADGVLWPFLVERDVRRLLERHLQRRTAHAHLATRVLDVLGGGRTTLRAVEAPQLVEPLSESELRVLRHLPTNLSAPEIGRELFVSVNTVKTHMRHIYAKLGAHGRTEAVEAARSLGLLAPSAKKVRGAVAQTR